MRRCAIPDIRIVQNTQFPKYSVTCDWSLLEDGSLDETQALATAVIVALGTDALAAPNDALPDPDSTDRAGWWGNLDAEEIWNGWDIGCKIWLMKRDKIVGSEAWTGATTTRIEQYIRTAIQPFADRRICSRYEVWVDRVGREQINTLIRLYRGPDREIDLRFQILWEGIEDVNPDFNVGRIYPSL